MLKHDIITAIATSDAKWLTPDEICNFIQCPPNVVQDCLADLEEDGLIISCETPNYIFVTLTDLSRHPFPDAPSKTDAITTDEKEGWDIMSFPTVLLGSGVALWDNVKHKICPGCGGRELREYEYCLLCDKWGLDHLLVQKSMWG